MTLPRLLTCLLLVVCLADSSITQDRPPASEDQRGNRDPDRAPNRRADGGAGPREPGPRDPNLFPPRDGDPRPPRRDDTRPPMGPNFAPGRYPPGMTRFGGTSLFGGESEDPEMRRLLDEDAQLDRAAQELAQQIRLAGGEERDALKKELESALNKHFEVRQQRRELQLKRLDEELKRLRKAIDERNDSRKEIIDKRLSELIGEPRDLEF